MKKLVGIILVTVFVIFAIADIVHDFIANDPIHYFSERPHQLLLVAAISIVGGSMVFFFYQLSPRLQRKFKLLTLGSAAGFLTLACAWFLYNAADFSFAGGHALIFVLLSMSVCAVLLWFEFYQVFKS